MLIYDQQLSSTEKAVLRSTPYSFSFAFSLHAHMDPHPLFFSFSISFSFPTVRTVTVIRDL